MVKKLPTGDFKVLTQDEIQKFDCDAINLDGDRTYALLIEYESPDDVKLKTCDLP